MPSFDQLVPELLKTYISDETMKATHNVSFWKNVTLPLCITQASLQQHSEIHCVDSMLLPSLSLGDSGEGALTFQREIDLGLNSNLATF